MPIAEAIGRIWHHHFVQGKTIREIARGLKLVRKHRGQRPAISGDGVVLCVTDLRQLEHARSAQGIDMIAGDGQRARKCSATLCIYLA
jgi:hypothetical protein